jgi:hypothetical protein
MIVCCIKVGIAYGPEYPNRLAAAVGRNLHRPHRFVCLTDDPTGLRCPSEPIFASYPGWWSKLVLFKPHAALMGERVLYLDLDTVILQDIGFLADYQGDFALLRDFYRPAGYGSAIMSIAPGWGQTIWNQFRADPVFIMQSLHGDQEWIETVVTGADLWQDLYPGRIGSYKADALQAGPKDFSLVCFHGTPKPHELDGWVHDCWH